MNKINKGILYISLHNQLVKKYGENRLVKENLIYEKFGRHFQIPKGLRRITLIEIENLGLVKCEGKFVRILPCKINIEEEPRKVFDMVGLK